MDKTEYTTEFDIKLVLAGAEESIKRADSDWRASTAAEQSFAEMYPKVDKPEYTPEHKITPRLIDHSMGYVGVSFRDEERSGRQYTLVFSRANEVHEVYMTHEDLDNFVSHIHGVLQAGIRAGEKRKKHLAVLDAWESADKLRREAIGKLERRAKALWKRLKKQGKLVEVDDEVDEDGIPF